MMKKIVRYECEICNCEYENIEDALECEARGLPVFYPIGTIWGNHNEGSFYEEITFAVAVNRSVKHSHSNYGGSWACRDNGAGDTLGKSKCGSGTLRLTEWHNKLNPEHPTFKRMVAYLESEGIDVRVWNGKEAVYLEEWLKEYESST